MRSPRKPGSVWAAGQRSARFQRGDRYIDSGKAHPAKMLAAIARHAVLAYSRPGDVVLDPMCGVGTVPVEAIDAGRCGYGVDYEPEWVGVAATNLHLARQRHPDAEGSVWQGDARRLTTVLPTHLHGAVDLVVTSPPYGSSTHGYWPAGRAAKVLHTFHRYSRTTLDKTQLAHRDIAGLHTGLVEIFAQCRQALKPGGTLVVTARPWTRQGRMVDFPSIVTTAAHDAGLAAHERCVALMARWDGRQLVPHHSFFRLHLTRRARADGKPGLLPVHEDVLVFVRPS